MAKSAPKPKLSQPKAQAVTETIQQVSGNTDTKPVRTWPKGGRPSKAQILARYKDETESFARIRDKWAYVGERLLDQASEAARNPKKVDGRSLVALVTASGISYDKRWAKQTSDSTEIELHPLLLAALTTKLSTDTQSNQQVSTEVAHLTEECDSADQAAEPAVIDPVLLDPGGVGLAWPC